MSLTVLPSSSGSCGAPSFFPSFGEALAAAGFYPASPLPQPTNEESVEWSMFRNVLESAFGSRLSWVWDGTTFAT